MRNRRDFLWHSGGGLGGIALSSLLGGEARGGGVLQEAHHRPKAKRVIQLFMAGAASHLDLFDYKPELLSDTVKNRILESMWKPFKMV
jgi:hypothetical protein